MRGANCKVSYSSHVGLLWGVTGFTGQKLTSRDTELYCTSRSWTVRAAHHGHSHCHRPTAACQMYGGAELFCKKVLVLNGGRVFEIPNQRYIFSGSYSDLEHCGNGMRRATLSLILSLAHVLELTYRPSFCDGQGALLSWPSASPRCLSAGYCCKSRWIACSIAAASSPAAQRPERPSAAAA